ncbi:TPA: HAMP domain-containing protein, partial [Candidatus Poribacteria bacterium]|nr:HAMP domain-containing protein [Candidatus Poribacteria bacterium]
MKERKGVPLTLKITMVSLGVLLVSLLALGMYSYRTTKEKLISHTLHEISAELSRISDEVNLVLRNQIHAVLLLSGLPIFQSEEGEVSLKWPGERVKRMLERVFVLVASEQREFFQIRLLSTDGMELLRLDATSQMLRFTPTAELQDKSGRYYFTEAMKLSPGEVYISPIDLNVEHGEIEVPHRPTYRIATPIFNEAGERLGVIVVNVDARSLLDSFYAKLKGGTVYLVDQDGYFLEHPDSSMTFGRELGTGHNLSKEMPELYRRLRSSLEEYAGQCEGGRTIYGMRKIYYAGQKEDRFWALFEVIPTEVVLADTREVRNRFLMDGGLIGGMAFALGFILLRFFSRPITRLSQLAQRVAEGDLDVRASDEEKRRDEIGVLARAFNQMISSLREATMNLREQVEKQTEELRRRNEELRRQARYLEETDLYNRTFVEILYLFTELTDHKAVCNEILSVLAERHGYPVGITYSYDEWSDTLTLCSAYSAPATVKEEIKVGEGIVGQAALSRKPILIPLSSLTLELGLNDVHPAAILALPVRYRERLFGVMVLASLSEPSEREKEFLHRLSILIGAGMNSLRQFLNLQRLSRELQERQVEIERKNRELLQAQKMKDQFMANMSHELRTPLNSIIGFADLLKEKIIGTLNEKQLQYVQNILQSAEHLLSIINDILDLSKVEAGMMEVKPEVISLKDLIESSLTMVGERAAKHRISLSMEIGEGIGTVRTDPTRLKQILFNLLSNAVKFTPDGGSVSVKA